MYDMTQNRLPAPYELNQPQMQPQQPPQLQPQSFAKGGSTRHKGMTTVHMNPHELHVLDHLQGQPEYGHGGERKYSHLEELLKNPHIVENVRHHARQHHAEGGLTPGMEHLREGGRHGDSELAMIGPHTRHLFNELAGHPTPNPNTGHPEYFSISNALSGIWKSVKNNAGDFARAAAPSLLPMAASALGNRFGPMAGMAGNLAAQGIQSRLGSPSGNANPYASALGKGLGSAAQSYGGGANASQAFGKGLNSFGSSVGGGFGNAAGAAGQALHEGRGFGEAARTGAMKGYNELGGAEGLRNAAGQVGQGLMQGGMGGARQALGNQMSQYMQRGMPQHPANQIPQAPPMPEHLITPHNQAAMYG